MAPRTVAQDSVAGCQAKVHHRNSKHCTLN